MRIVTEADALTDKIMGEQEYEEKSSYRLLSWCAFLDYENGRLLHNYMTGETLFFDAKEDFESSDTKKALIKKWFMVPEESDDVELLEELRAAMKLFDNREGVDSYKILTTTDCNARCFYCYELGIKKENMTEETARKSADYILRSSGDSKVTLAWFGGEPMMNPKVIDIICGALKDNKKEYASVMTSNGYLFDEDTVKRATDEWNLKNIQITLDGTKEVYNRVKAYAENDDNPFGRVLKNIHLLSDAGVRVNIRLNLSLENGDDILRLINELGREFKDNDNVSAYVSGLFQETLKTDACFKKELSEKLIEASNALSKNGLTGSKFTRLHTRAGGCMADSDNHRGISPSGRLMKCEHFIYDRLVGSIDEGDDKEAIEGWKKRMPDGRLCGTCVVRPVCYRLEGCPVSHPCDEFEQKEFILRKEKQLLKNVEIAEAEKKIIEDTDLTDSSEDEIC